MTRYKDLFYVSLLLIIGSFLIFYKLGASALIDMDESRYAESAREMIELDDYVIPRLNYEVRLNKPIMFYWFVIAAFKTFGINEFAARFPSALFGILGIMAAYFFGRALFNKETGLFSGLILAASPQYLIISRLSIIDMSLNFFVIMSLILFWAGYKSVKNKDIYYNLVYLFSAVAFLLKGPIAVIIVFLIAAAFLAFNKDLKEFKRFLSLKGACIFAAVALPWFLAAYLKYGVKESLELLHRETVGRYFGAAIHLKPIYFFFPVLAAGFSPWIIFLPSALIKFLKRDGDENDGKKIFILTWVCAVFIFFSLCKSKVPTYILPMFLPLSLVMGSFWHDTIKSGKKERNILTGIPVILFFICIIAASVVTMFVIKEHPQYVNAAATLTVIALIAASLSLFFYLVKKPALIFSTFLVFTAAVMIVIQNFVLPVVEARRSTKHISRILVQKIKPDDMLITYKMANSSVIFYTKHKVLLLHDRDRFTGTMGEERKCYALIDEGDFEEIKAGFKKPVTILDKYGETLLISN